MLTQARGAGVDRPSPMVEVVLSRVPRFLSAHYQGPNNEILPNAGLAYLAGTLRAAGISYRLMEPLTADPGGRDFSREIALRRPRIVGFTCASLDIDNAGLAAAAVKLVAPGAFVVVGGAHPSALPRETLEQYPEFDGVVVGEGELTLLELTAAIREGRELRGINGLVYRQDGQIVVNPPREQIADIDDLPFPCFDGLDLRRYRQFYAWMNAPSLPVGASRGCPYRCNFCFHPFGATVRARRPANVVREIEEDHRTYGARSIVFVDESFTLDNERTEEFCRLMIAEGLDRKIGWLLLSRVDCVSPTLVALMKQAGCTLISFGVESGNPQILRQIGKRVTLEQAREALRLCRRQGIYTAASFQIGQPGETPATVRETVSFAMNADIDYANFCLTTPIPGTQIAAMAREGKGGLVLLSTDWRKYDKTGGALELRNLSASRLAWMQRLAYMRFYLRPSHIKRLFELAPLSVFIRYLWWSLLQGWLKQPAAGK